VGFCVVTILGSCSKRCSTAKLYASRAAEVAEVRYGLPLKSQNENSVVFLKLLLSQARKGELIVISDINFHSRGEQWSHDLFLIVLLYDLLLPRFARGLSGSLGQLVRVNVEGSLKNYRTAEPLQIQSEGMISTGTQERYKAPLS
jgi:hypothetical protein